MQKFKRKRFFVVIAIVISMIFVYEQFLVEANNSPGVQVTSEVQPEQRPHVEEVLGANILSSQEQSHGPSIHSAALENNDSKLSQELQEKYELVNNNPAYPSLTSRLETIVARRPGASIDAEELLSAVEKKAAWELDKQQERAQEHLSTLNIRDAETIRFDRMKVESLVIGDTLEIPIKQTGETYQVRIASVKENVDNNITWRGILLHEGKNYRVSFTQNSNGLTIGGINTPNGHFTLEAHDDYGWISNSHANVQGRLDQDYVTPNIN